jgi:hypothetical protein
VLAQTTLSLSAFVDEALRRAADRVGARHRLAASGTGAARRARASIPVRRTRPIACTSSTSRPGSSAGHSKWRGGSALLVQSAPGHRRRAGANLVLRCAT